MGIKHEVMRQEPAFFCSLLVQNKPTWLHLEKVKIQAVFFFFCINVVGMKSADGHFCAFFTFLGHLTSSLHFPFKKIMRHLQQSKIGNG